MTVQERIEKVKSLRLTQLDLSDCGLYEIPQEVFELTELQTLILGKNYPPRADQSNRNQISYIPVEISLLKNLRGLGFANNNFIEFPTVITNLPYLQTLMMNDNQLSLLPAEIGQLRHLRILGLNNNQLYDLPAEIGNVRRLKVLGLTNNRLTQLPDTVRNLTYLEQLGLSGNQLTEIPSAIFEFEDLQALGLANNNIETFPKELMKLRRLQRLDLSGNPLPRKIITTAAKGHQAIQYFFSQKASQRQKLIKNIVDGRKEAIERSKLKDRFFRLLNSNSTICAVCDGTKKVDGFIGHLNMRFDNDKCFGCNGEGVANDETDDLHKLLETCHQQKERCRDKIIILAGEEQSFTRKIQASRPNQNILFEETVQSIREILNSKRHQIDIRAKQFSNYQLFEQKILITLYNLHLHQITMQERFDKGEYGLEIGDSPINVFSISRTIESIMSEQEALFDALVDMTSPEGIADIQERLAELAKELKQLS